MPAKYFDRGHGRSYNCHGFFAGRFDCTHAPLLH